MKRFISLFLLLTVLLGAVGCSTVTFKDFKTYEGDFTALAEFLTDYRISHQATVPMTVTLNEGSMYLDGTILLVDELTDSLTAIAKQGFSLAVVYQDYLLLRKSRAEPYALLYLPDGKASFSAFSSDLPDAKAHKLTDFWYEVTL